jgi:ADP-ribose pyrophosphatase
MWKKLSSKTILDHPRLKVIEDEVELPNGHKTDYLVFDRKGDAPLAIVINSDNKILVSNEYSYPVGEVLFQFPGGYVKYSEDIDEGIRRELMEEVGLHAEHLQKLGFFYPNDRRSNMKSYVYIAKNLTEQKLDGDLEEAIDYLWFSEDEIDQLIRKNKFKHGPSLATWAIYKASK